MSYLMAVILIIGLVLIASIYLTNKKKKNKGSPNGKTRLHRKRIEDQNSILEFKYVVFLNLLGCFLFFLGKYTFQDIWAFSAGVFCAGIVELMFQYYDDFALRKINTRKMILGDENELHQKPNMVYVAYMFIHAFILVCSFSLGFILFFTLK